MRATPESSPAARGWRAARRDGILDAAIVVFSHYGFRRSSLDEIAREAGSSRTALYHYFGSKDEIFRAMVDALHERTLGAAEKAARGPGPTSARLVGALAARLGGFHEALHDSRHGRELLEQTSRLTGDLVAEGRVRFRKLLASVLRRAERAGELDLKRAGFGLDAAASFLLLSAEGLKGGEPPPTPAEFRERLERLVAVFLRGAA